MGKSRTAQLIYQSSFCAIGIIGIIASLGLFEHTFRSNFYVYFTNLSNYMCIGIMFAELIQTAKKQGDSYVTVLPTLKFMGVLAISLTFLVFNLVLAPTRDAAVNHQAKSIILHMILPPLYIADWFLFYERGQVKWYDPLRAISVPLVYVVFVFLRAWSLGYDPNVPYIYPYFFLNPVVLGWSGVLKWIVVLAAAFAAVGYIFFALDRMIKSPGGKAARK